MNKSTLTLRDSVQKSPDPTVAEVDGETVMISIEQGNYYGLGETGSRIWDLIGEPTQIETLVEKLVDAYEVERDVCVQDTLEFLGHLQANNLINVTKA